MAVLPSTSKIKTIWKRHFKKPFLSIRPGSVRHLDYDNPNTPILQVDLDENKSIIPFRFDEAQYFPEPGSSENKDNRSKIRTYPQQRIFCSQNQISYDDSFDRSGNISIMSIFPQRKKRNKKKAKTIAFHKLFKLSHDQKFETEQMRNVFDTTDDIKDESNSSTTSFSSQSTAPSHGRDVLTAKSIDIANDCHDTRREVQLKPEDTNIEKEGIMFIKDPQIFSCQSIYSNFFCFQVQQERTESFNKGENIVLGHDNECKKNPIRASHKFNKSSDVEIDGDAGFEIFPASIYESYHAEEISIKEESYKFEAESHQNFYVGFEIIPDCETLNMDLGAFSLEEWDESLIKENHCQEMRNHELMDSPSWESKEGNTVLRNDERQTTKGNSNQKNCKVNDSHTNADYFLNIRKHQHKKQSERNLLLLDQLVKEIDERTSKI